MDFEIINGGINPLSSPQNPPAQNNGCHNQQCIFNFGCPGTSSDDEFLI